MKITRNEFYVAAVTGELNTSNTLPRIEEWI